MMCSNYTPVTRSDRMMKFFGVVRERTNSAATGARALSDARHAVRPPCKTAAGQGRRLDAASIGQAVGGTAPVVVVSAGAKVRHDGSYPRTMVDQRLGDGRRPHPPRLPIPV